MVVLSVDELEDEVEPLSVLVDVDVVEPVLMLLFGGWVGFTIMFGGLYTTVLGYAFWPFSTHTLILNMPLKTLSEIPTT